jgi:hypothetical protein
VAKTHNDHECEHTRYRNGQRIEGSAGDALCQRGCDRSADNGEYQHERSDQFSCERPDDIDTDPVPVQTRENPDAILGPRWGALRCCQRHDRLLSYCCKYEIH